MNSSENSVTVRPNKKQTLRMHIAELRRRAVWVSLVMFVGMGIGFWQREFIINFLVKPLQKKTLIYTSPTGGFEFIIQICFFVGILVATPVLIYQILKFLKPISTARKMRSFGLFMLFSVLLLFAGVAFAWTVSLPAALHFLTTISNQHIEALLSTNEYMSFVMLYLAGFGLLFQVPLLLLFINNHIKPLRPEKLFRSQKYLILGSFIISAILTPTPDPVNQLLMAVPIILLYQVGVVAVWLANLRVKKLRRTRIVKEPFVIKTPKKQPAPPPIQRRSSTPQPKRPIMDITVPQYSYATFTQAQPKSKPTQPQYTLTPRSINLRNRTTDGFLPT